MMQSYISGGRQGKVSDGDPSTKHESAGKSQRDLCAKAHSSPVAQKRYLLRYHFGADNWT